jgi:hypothetical protein
MEELKRKHEQGCWFWNDDYTALLHREPHIPRELIEQAKEEMFFAWGL